MTAPVGEGLVAIAGATGYVGGRLREALEARGATVRCLARRPEALAGRLGPLSSVVRADVLAPESLVPALAGVETAYYLIHSMGAREDFEELDRRGARLFARACAEAGVRRIVYLGGLGDERVDLSPHLRSRHEVGRLLREGGVPVVELRASIVVGSGSLSFEMIRALVERLPVMVTPRWVSVEAQPIGIEALVEYLVQARTVPLAEGRIVEIGGPDRVTYGELMREYARQRGLRRWMIGVPFLTPRLSSLWLGLVTPLYARVGRKLIESITHRTVVLDPSGQELFDVRPCTAAEAIARALEEEEQRTVSTHWYDALSSAGPPREWTNVRFGNRRIESRSLPVAAAPERTFDAIERVGGENGWYAHDWLWSIRGFLDLLVGGVGVRRGRPHPERLRVGDAVDFWRVEALDPGRRLLLSAEMRLPGRAWLELAVDPEGEDRSVVRLIAIFDPVGLAGIVYWALMKPLHRPVFSGMLKGIVRHAEQAERAHPVRDCA